MYQTLEREREREGERERERVSWCFTPSQPVRLYQGEHRDRERHRERQMETKKERDTKRWRVERDRQTHT